MLVKFCFSLHFIPPDPDPGTQINAGPIGSGSTSLVYTVGLYADSLSCDRCPVNFSSLHQLNQHRSQVHNYKQVLVGENVLFEKPSGKLAMKAGYFCPIPTCKYNIASSGRAKFFSTAKLLKQHYAKVREVFYRLRISSMTAKCSLGPWNEDVVALVLF